MSDDETDYSLSNWELTAHVMHHEDEIDVHKQALGIILGHLYTWSNEDRVDEELVDDLLATLITSYVRSYHNYFSPRDPAEGAMNAEEMLARFRDMFLNEGGEPNEV